MKSKSKINRNENITNEKRTQTAIPSNTKIKHKLMYGKPKLVTEITSDLTPIHQRKTNGGNKDNQKKKHTQRQVGMTITNKKKQRTITTKTTREIRKRSKLMQNT